jgi:hypothetical protein
VKDFQFKACDAFHEIRASHLLLIIDDMVALSVSTGRYGDHAIRSTLKKPRIHDDQAGFQSSRSANFLERHNFGPTADP